jgi:hypothetical protein
VIRKVGKPRGRTKAFAQQTHCCRGHPFDQGNTRRWVDGQGYQHRQCRACHRLRAREKRRLQHLSGRAAQ